MHPIVEDTYAGSVIYSSQTGNTRKLTTQIFGDSWRFTGLKNIDEYREKDAELYFVGFLGGDCDEKDSRTAFRVCMAKDRPVRNLGMGNDPAYYQKVIDRVKTWIPEDNEYMDAFLCQGKMPIQVRADATRKWQRADKIPNRFRL